MRHLDPRNPFDIIPATLATNPDLVACVPVFEPHSPDSTLVLAAKLRTRRLPPELAVQWAQSEHEAAGGNGGPVDVPTHIQVGRVLLTIPADMAANLRGPVAERHPLWLLSVHRSAYDEAMRQAESGIILPGGVSVPGGGIVKP